MGIIEECMSYAFEEQEKAIFWAREESLLRGVISVCNVLFLCDNFRQCTNSTRRLGGFGLLTSVF